MCHFLKICHFLNFKFHFIFEIFPWHQSFNIWWTYRMFSLPDIGEDLYDEHQAGPPILPLQKISLYIESMIGKIHLWKLHDIMISRKVRKVLTMAFDASAELILNRFFEQSADNNVLSQYSITWSKSCNTGGGSSSSHLWETDNQIHFIITEKLAHVKR